MIQTINPASGTLLKEYRVLEENEINARIDAAHSAYCAWRLSKFSHRKQLMLNLASLLKKDKRAFATLMSSEMGKPLKAGESEIEKCAWVCEHYAQHAEQYLQDRIIETELHRSKVCYRPLGVVFAIMPWNYPFWQVFRFAAPTLMAGNAGILKHAPISTGTGEAIAELIEKAGFPKHLFQHFVLDNEKAAYVVAHEHIIGVTLTGSEKAGQAIASNAGQHLKKTVLELGGSDPYLILEDADLDLAAETITRSRISNTGQTCIAPKRILAVKPVYAELVAKIKAQISKYKMGDPLDAASDYGPMAREDLRVELHEQVLRTVTQGAKLECGGKIPDGKGFYYPATLLTDVKPGMCAFEEELFGPVIAVSEVEDEAEAIWLANKSRYGLGAAVYTKDLEKGERIASNEIESGTCFVNAVVGSDPRLPFGGIKKSGYGRELSREGILEFVNAKTVAVNNPKG